MSWLSYSVNALPLARMCFNQGPPNRRAATDRIATLWEKEEEVECSLQSAEGPQTLAGPAQIHKRAKTMPALSCDVVLFVPESMWHVSMICLRRISQVQNTIDELQSYCKRLTEIFLTFHMGF